MKIRLTPLLAALMLLGCAELAHSDASSANNRAAASSAVTINPPSTSAPASAIAMPTASAAAPAAAGGAKAIEDQEPAVTAQLREVLQKISDGSIGQEYFTDRAIASLFPDQVKTYAARLQALGGVSALELLSRTVDGENRVYRYRVLGQNGKLLLDVVYGKSARINQFALSSE